MKNDAHQTIFGERMMILMESLQWHTDIEMRVCSATQPSGMGMREDEWLAKRGLTRVYRMRMHNGPE